MRDELKSIIDAELDEKEQSLEEIYEPMQDEINKLIDEQNKKVSEGSKDEYDEYMKKDNLSEEDIAKIHDEGMQEAMKYLNRDDN